MIHTLRREMWLPLKRQDLFPFFADAGNLERITPPALRFEITSQLPIEMAQGALIQYRMRLHGVPFRWKTQISTWEPDVRFVDEQLRGPYRTWVHLHEFEERDGGTYMLDEVRYSLPLTPLGDIVHPLVRRELDTIFDYRRDTIREILAPDSAESPDSFESPEHGTSGAQGAPGS